MVSHVLPLPIPKMRVFGLHPDQVLARGPVSRPPPSRPFSMVYAALGFAVVSVIAFSIWTLFKESRGMYAAIAVVYIALAGLVLSRLVAGQGAVPRFAGLFALAFLLYAFGWCAFWFGLRGRHAADLWGAIVGLAAMTWLIQHAFGQTTGFLTGFLVLLGFYSLGYYAGGALHAKVHGTVGKLLWGAAYGFGFGTGLGFLLARCQEPLKLRLRSGPLA